MDMKLAWGLKRVENRKWKNPTEPAAETQGLFLFFWDDGTAETIFFDIVFLHFWSSVIKGDEGKAKKPKSLWIENITFLQSYVSFK